MKSLATVTVDKMRQILAEEISSLRNGKTTAQNLNAITNASGKLVQSAKLELAFAEHAGVKCKSSFIGID